jgi:hypothetical protein
MAEELGVRRFINVGPGPTLRRFCERVPLRTPVEVVDLFDLIDVREASERRTRWEPFANRGAAS